MINGRFMTVSAMRSEIAARQRADRIDRIDRIERMRRDYRRVERGAMRSGDERDLTSGDVQRRRTVVGLRARDVQNDRRVRRQQRRVRGSERQHVSGGVDQEALRDSEVVKASVTRAGDSMSAVAIGTGVIRDVAVQASTTDASRIDRPIGMGEMTEDLDDMIRSGIDGEMSNEQMTADDNGERRIRDVIARNASHEERTEIEETILALRAEGIGMQEIFDLIRPA